jgi:hypothetical protein
MLDLTISKIIENFYDLISLFGIRLSGVLILDLIYINMNSGHKFNLRWRSELNKALQSVLPSPAIQLKRVKDRCL